MRALSWLLKSTRFRDGMRNPSRLPRVVWQGPAPTIYAVGDVHGCLLELAEAERKIAADGGELVGEKLIVMLGDYVDRGPRSRDVLDHLLRPPPDGFLRVCIRGNHDDAMRRFFETPDRRHAWLGMGGFGTLSDYGPQAVRALGVKDPFERARRVREAAPPSHLDFLNALPTALVIGDLVFVHAGLAPGAPLDAQTDRDLMWIREPFLTRGSELPVTVIHGHTPTDEPSFGPGRIGIDLGVSATGRLGVLRIGPDNCAFL